MTTRRRHALRVALAAALLLVGAVHPVRAGAKRLYLNSYGSSWGLWVRGTCLLEARGGGLFLEIEELTLEPNHNYPQAFEIAGFRLASVPIEKTTEDRKDMPPTAGPQVAHSAALTPGEKTLVKGLRLELPAGRPRASGDRRLLLLQILTPSGAALEIDVTKLNGG